MDAEEVVFAVCACCSLHRRASPRTRILLPACETRKRLSPAKKAVTLLPGSNVARSATKSSA